MRHVALTDPLEAVAVELVAVLAGPAGRPNPLAPNFDLLCATAPSSAVHDLPRGARLLGLDAPSRLKLDRCEGAHANPRPDL
jgi:hypothetical protein